MCVRVLYVCVFFFKQKTAYDMRISDWSSDVCSSDLIGGGGSILALPLLLYVVGMKDPHVAIGTSALAVAANAFANLVQHARAGTVKWPCALVFGVSGVAGALIGSTLGKMVAGQHLLVLFAGVMIVEIGRAHV